MYGVPQWSRSILFVLYTADHAARHGLEFSVDYVSSPFVVPLISFHPVFMTRRRRWVPVDMYECQQDVGVLLLAGQDAAKRQPASIKFTHRQSTSGCLEQELYY